MSIDQPEPSWYLPPESAGVPANPPGDRIPDAGGTIWTTTLKDGRRFRWRGPDRGTDAFAGVAQMARAGDQAALPQAGIPESPGMRFWIDTPPAYIANDWVASIDLGDLGHQPLTFDQQRGRGVLTGPDGIEVNVADHVSIRDVVAAVLAGKPTTARDGLCTPLDK